MAIISLKGIRLFGHHGFYPEEETLGREFVLDVQVKVDVAAAAAGDELSNSVNYETLYHICQAEFRQPVKLLETVAQRILDRIMRQFDDVAGVRVVIHKMNPPLGGVVDEASVEVSSGELALSVVDLMELLKKLIE